MTERAELGIDGNCGYALLGPNLQEGEAEFSEIGRVDESKIPGDRHEWFTGGVRHSHELSMKLAACKIALEKLRKRLNKPELSYYFGPSHPYGN